MEPSNLVFAGLFAGIAAFWSQAKTFASNMSSLAVRINSIKGRWACMAFLERLLEDGKVVRFGNQSLREVNLSVKGEDIMRVLLFDSRSKIWVKYGKSIIYLTAENEDTIKVIFAVGTFDFNKVLENSLVKANNSDKRLNKKSFSIIHRKGKTLFEAEPGVFGESPHGLTSSQDVSLKDTVFSDYYALGEQNGLVGAKHNQIGWNSPKDSFCYFWTDEAKLLLKEVSFWIENEEWFKQRRISWQRGALLYSRPGEGKTKMVVAVAKKLQLRVEIFDLSTYSNSELKSAWDNLEQGTIVLFEDFDCIFQGRERVNKDPKKILTFDFLLNLISGASEHQGIFVVITTNHIESFDAALIRPGRIDIKIFIKPMTEEGKIFIAQSILHGYPETIQRVVKESQDQSVAEFQNACIQAALEEFNKKAESTELLSN